MITVEGLTKKYGSTIAVDSLSFTVKPGRVTGFLGPNGSGKSTTMRCMIGLDRVQSGTALFDGKLYQELKKPLHEVGTLLDAVCSCTVERMRSMSPARTGLSQRRPSSPGDPMQELRIR